MVSCKNENLNKSFPIENANSLSDMINEGLNKNEFYLVSDNKFSENTNSILFILPNFSCFNCFQHLVDKLALYYESNNLSKIIVLKSNNIKDREIRYSLRNVVEVDSIEILDGNVNPLVEPHDFFPKLGFIKNGKLSCVEIFEQDNFVKIENYFNFLSIMM
jgi:hypothetical protein